MSGQPLRGLTVVEIGQFIAAPYATMVLADLGARVIKVEPPHGDGIRGWGPHVGGQSAPFLAYNRNKECVAADLGSDEGRALVEEILGTADIVVENNRPGVLSRFGFDADAVRERYPSIIYCSITGYGTDSPYAKRPGFDLVIQGITGLISITGSDGAEPAKVGVPIVDGTASLHGTTAILAALHERERTGEGATIDISLQASTMTWMMLLASAYFATGQAPRRLGTAHPLTAPYQGFRAQDGFMTIAAGNDRQWERACGVLGLEQLMQDERFLTNADRARHQEALKALFEERLVTRPRAEWIAELSAAGVPCGMVNDLPEALDDPALVQRDLITAFEHPDVGEVRTIGNPIRFAGAPLAPVRAPRDYEPTATTAVTESGDRVSSSISDDDRS